MDNKTGWHTPLASANAKRSPTLHVDGQNWHAHSWQRGYHPCVRTNPPERKEKHHENITACNSNRNHFGHSALKIYHFELGILYALQKVKSSESFKLTFQKTEF